MRTTRQRILQIIQRQHTETVGGLARELNLAPATVRRHLDILQRDGMVEFAEIRKRTGRPEHSFSLTERGHESLPKGYDSLLSALVGEFTRIGAEDIAGKTGSEALDAALTRLGHGVGRGYLNSGTKTRLATAVQALRDGDFEPEVLERQGETRITLGNCPFRSVALADDAVCAYDTAILQAILGTAVRRERCISRGHACCEYVAETGTSPGGTAGDARSVDGPEGRV